MTAPSTVAVNTRLLTKRFRRVTAVDKLNLTLHEGEVTAFLGSNGSGKSTTFRLLLNIYQPSSGLAEIFGQPCHRLDGPDFETIAFISESQKIPLWMTVKGYMNYCSRFYPSWDSSFCQHLLNTLHLNPDPKIKHLSRGQKMKVALASVLPAHPRLLMLDEPFSGLDVETRDQLGSLLRSLGRERKLTTLLTTHDVEEVEPVADRIVLLHLGKILIDEPLPSFLGRHRQFSWDGSSDLPASFDVLRQGNEESGRSFCIIQNYSQDLEGQFRNSLPDGNSLQSNRLPLRNILTARAIPW